jgi:hypothetical protein
MLLLVCIILIYIACAIHNWGFTLGDFTFKYPARNHIPIAMFMAISGPIGLLTVLFYSKNKHWRWRPLSVEERWQAFSKDYAILGREYFDKYRY